MLLTGKVKEAVSPAQATAGSVYDAVVMDAPPTGRITRFLNVTDEVQGLAKVGPIHHQAQSVMRLLRSHETAVHLVTLLEEMPVQETVDGVAELEAAGLPVGGIVVNLVREPLLRRPALARRSSGSARPGRARRSSPRAPASSCPAGRPRRRWPREAAEHAQRVALEDVERDELADARACRCTSCRSSPTPSTSAACNRLADLLADQGLA